MSKGSIIEIHSLSIKGVLNVNNMSVETEDLGVKSLSDLIENFDGENISIKITKNSELSE